MQKIFRTIVILCAILVIGFAVVQWGLPRLLQNPAVVRLPPGVKMTSTGEIEESKMPVPVRTFKAARIEFTDQLPTLGTIRGQTEVDLKFEMSGVVKSVEFREGDLVSQGQVLATLNDTEVQLRLQYAQAKVKTAEAQLAVAQKRLEVNEQLFQIGAIIRPKLEESQLEAAQAKTQVVSAQKERDLAEAELTKTILKAPFDGVMGTREAEPGAYVSINPPTVVGTLVDVTSVYVELGIIERDIERIRMGQKVKVTIDSLPNKTFDGMIDNLAPMIEGKSRTLTAKVKVENTKGQLLPGMFARAEIAVYQKPNALVVPTTALKDTDGDGKLESVFTAEGHVARLKKITTGYVTTDYAEIADGLQEGDQVITEARGSLSDGSKILLLESEEAGVERTEPSISGGQKETGE